MELARHPYFPKLTQCNKHYKNLHKNNSQSKINIFLSKALKLFSIKYPNSPNHRYQNSFQPKNKKLQTTF